jgi:hypothetical protein
MTRPTLKLRIFHWHRLRKLVDIASRLASVHPQIADHSCGRATETGSLPSRQGVALIGEIVQDFNEKFEE